MISLKIGYEVIFYRDWSQSCTAVGTAPANLLYDYIYLVTIFHIEFLGSLVLVQSFAVEEESHVVGLELDRNWFTDCLWQYASINFLSWVVFLILKKTYSPS